MDLPTVALIGKPNVGKSTLFNRLIGYRKAIVSPTPGTTRDRNFEIVYGAKPYLLVDTGGIQKMQENVIEENIYSQAQMAIADADLILFLVDVKDGITKKDHDVVALLRKSKKDVVLIASKSDSGMEDVSEYFKLGFGTPLPVSATHNSGVEDLIDAVTAGIPKVTLEKRSGDAVRVAIMGRPNVGKSSFINKLLGSDRLIVSEIAGTTIDSADIQFTFEEQEYVLVDTAGVKRRGKRGSGIDKYSFMRSLKAAETADVCVVLIDGDEGPTKQDLHTVEYVLQQHSGVILVVNKWDLAEKGQEAQSEFLHRLKHAFEFLPWAPVVFTSAKTGKNIHQIFPLVQQIKNVRQTRIQTSVLNNWLERTVHEHTPTGSGRKLPKVFYISQIDTEPPHFVLQVNNEEWLHFSYVRYLENRLREQFDFTGTAIKFELKGKEKRKR
jgi:GTPase